MSGFNTEALNRILYDDDLLPLDLETFIEKVNQTNNLDDIFELLLNYIQHLGFERVAYVVRWPADAKFKVLCLTNHPENWVSHYQNERYSQIDYVGIYANRTVVPFIWSTILSKVKLTKKQRMVFSDAVDAGMAAGGTVPLHGPIAVKALMTVTNNMSDAEFQRLFLEKRHQLQLVSSFAHEKVMDLNLNKNLADRNPLTPREIEILTWMARGKTRSEAAIILGVTEDTVSVHLRTIRAKMDVGNTVNAVATAVVNGLIAP